MAKPYLRGVPTEMDIKILRDRYPEGAMLAGDRIPYAEVEELLQIQYRSHRWNCVTTRWRQVVEREAGVIIAARNGEAFEVLSDSQKLALSGQKIGAAVKSVQRSLIIGTRINKAALTAEELRRMAHNEAVASKIIGSSQIRGRARILPQM